MSHRLWYDTPATEFNASLPIGNGRLGAMVAGGVHSEAWVLNEDSIWSGGSMDRNPKNAAENLSLLRQLVLQNRLVDAEQLVCRAFYGTPESMRHYEVAGRVMFDFHHPQSAVSGYGRWLDLEAAVTGSEYAIGNVTYKREIFASHLDDAICAKFTASDKGALSFDMRLSRGNGLNVHCDSVEANRDTLMLRNTQAGHGVTFSITATVRLGRNQGHIRCLGETIVVEDAQEAEIYIAIETTFRHEDPASKCFVTLDHACLAGFLSLRKAHVADYAALAGRCVLDLGTLEDQTEFLSRPTDAWISDTKEGCPHPCLVALLFRFGRYLLISCSRRGPLALPANLQGLWNESLSPPWGSKYTININAQMNYWPAETCNLSDCQYPLFSLIERLAVNGEQTAKIMYGCRGWVSHHNTDMWADSAPQDRWLPATLWPMSGAWLCLHLWEHFLFTRDQAFLAKYIKIIRGSVQFFLDFLMDHEGFKVSSPSLSPENAYRLPNGEEGCICIAPAIDTQILRHLFDAYTEATNIIGSAEDVVLAQNAEAARSQLPPMKIGQYGQLQEWYDDHEEIEPGHRHMSHLWDVYPGAGTLTREPQFREACKVTLERRAAYGGGHTGWSRAWLIALAARLEDGELAADHITKLLHSSTLSNLLNDHPPFQIDGNFGSVAAIAEMLIQSHQGEIVLLPALPTTWTEGKVVGLCARGGFEVSIEWGQSRLLVAKVLSNHGETCRIKYRHGIKVLHGGQDVSESSEKREVVFSTGLGMTYQVLPYT